MKTWILIADAARARIFETSGANQELHQVQAYVHPGSRQKTSELVTDRPGRFSKGMSGGIRSAMEADTSAHALEADRFAATLATVLDRGLEQRDYRSLIIVAPPRFLGRLRSAISNRVFHSISQMLDRDFSRYQEEELSVALNRLLPIRSYA